MLEGWFKKWGYRQNIKKASVSNVSQCINLTNHNAADALYATTETVDADEPQTPHDTNAASLLADEPRQKLELTIRILTQIETKQSFWTRHS